LKNGKATTKARSAQSFRQDRYLVVGGLLAPPILDYLKVYYGIVLANGGFSADEQCPLSLARAGDSGFDAILEWIRPEISRLVGMELAPTYSYTRRYSKGEKLERHVDRDACEVSVTVSIQIPPRAGPSSIYLKTPRNGERRIDLREGDGCVYAGTEVEHWRDRFRTDGYIQLFLHYIRKRGPHYPALVFDGRAGLGTFYGTRRRKKA